MEADALRLAFRTVFLKGLRRLHRRGERKLHGEWAGPRDPEAFVRWLEPLERTSRVTYIEPPVAADTPPERMVKYLTR